MAYGKKEAKAPKKRTAVTLAPKEPDKVLGTVAIPVQVQVHVLDPSPFSEMVIEWKTLGLAEEPDKIVETSANSRYMDAKRPIETSEEGAHMFFDPPMSGAGLYGFQFLVTYNEAVETRTAAPKKKEEED